MAASWTYRTTWLFVRLPMFFVLGVAIFGTIRCLSVPVNHETTFDDVASPSGARHVRVSAANLGATGWGDAEVSIVTDGGGSCRALITSHRGLEGGRARGGDFEIAWLDETRVRLTYPASRRVWQVSTHCPGVDVEHVTTP